MVWFKNMIFLNMPKAEAMVWIRCGHLQKPTLTEVTKWRYFLPFILLLFVCTCVHLLNSLIPHLNYFQYSKCSVNLYLICKTCASKRKIWKYTKAESQIKDHKQQHWWVLTLFKVSCSFMLLKGSSKVIKKSDSKIRIAHQQHGLSHEL